MKIQVKKYTHFIVNVGYFEFGILIPGEINYAVLRSSVLHELNKLDIAEKAALATKITSLIINSK